MKNNIDMGMKKIKHSSWQLSKFYYAIIPMIAKMGNGGQGNRLNLLYNLRAFIKKLVASFRFIESAPDLYTLSYGEGNLSSSLYDNDLKNLNIFKNYNKLSIFFKSLINFYLNNDSRIIEKKNLLNQKKICKYHDYDFKDDDAYLFITIKKLCQYLSKIDIGKKNVFKNVHRSLCSLQSLLPVQRNYFFNTDSIYTNKNQDKRNISIYNKLHPIEGKSFYKIFKESNKTNQDNLNNIFYGIIKEKVTDNSIKKKIRDNNYHNGRKIDFHDDFYAVTQSKYSTFYSFYNRYFDKYQSGNNPEFIERNINRSSGLFKNIKNIKKSVMMKRNFISYDNLIIMSILSNNLKTNDSGFIFRIKSGDIFNNNITYKDMNSCFLNAVNDNVFFYCHSNPKYGSMQLFNIKKMIISNKKSNCENKVFMERILYLKKNTKSSPVEAEAEDNEIKHNWSSNEYKNKNSFLKYEINKKINNRFFSSGIYKESKSINDTFKNQYPSMSKDKGKYMSAVFIPSIIKTRNKILKSNEMFYSIFRNKIPDQYININETRRDSFNKIKAANFNDVISNQNKANYHQKDEPSHYIKRKNFNISIKNIINSKYTAYSKDHKTLKNYQDTFHGNFNINKNYIENSKGYMEHYKSDIQIISNLNRIKKVKDKNEEAARKEVNINHFNNNSQQQINKIQNKELMAFKKEDVMNILKFNKSELLEIVNDAIKLNRRLEY